MTPRTAGAAVAALAAGLALGVPSGGDVVVLGPGKSVRGTVFRGPDRVRVNPYRCTEMTWGVQEHPVSYVRAIEPERTAADVFRALDTLPAADAAGRRPLLETARALGRKDLVRRVAGEVLRVEPTDAGRRPLRRRARRRRPPRDPPRDGAEPPRGARAPREGEGARARRGGAREDGAGP
jgi:hypothetical protein